MNFDRENLTAENILFALGAVFVILACLTSGNDNYGEAAVACFVMGCLL